VKAVQANCRSGCSFPPRKTFWFFESSVPPFSFPLPLHFELVSKFCFLTSLFPNFLCRPPTTPGRSASRHGSRFRPGEGLQSFPKQRVIFCPPDSFTCMIRRTLLFLVASFPRTNPPRCPGHPPFPPKNPSSPLCFSRILLEHDLQG